MWLNKCDILQINKHLDMEGVIKKVLMSGRVEDAFGKRKWQNMTLGDEGAAKNVMSLT